eukprot:gnl/TRDRNA2_/TRDRNA2_133660_c1_seq1.p1 gnl/TRDRNA2_/TRDRNA2_133660_c1~~gnl/TRDRNA2_/TRDRNA2_133660_c1_seq1.p1  ORF type:complete len:744 (-),score=84.60 gnl/TRDRNA2_/TRDRNA2_133660_c1_seq1:33-2189(-)
MSGRGPWTQPTEKAFTGPSCPSSPSTPEQVEAGQTDITLRWSAPANDGGSPVVRYFIRGYEDRADEPVTPSEHGAVAVRRNIEMQTPDGATSIVVKALRGNTKYVFQVLALNCAGLSPPSAPSAPMKTLAVRPGPPLRLKAMAATAEKCAVKLQWEPPEYDGGEPVERYQADVHLQSCPQESATPTHTVCSSSLGCCVTGLRGNQKYVIRVRAENAVGLSGFAEVVCLTGPGPPGAPGVPRRNGKEKPTSVGLAWSAPLDDGGCAVMGYTVEGFACGPDDEPLLSSCVCAVEAGEQRCAINGLDPERRYRFRVRARSSEGVGPFSGWSAALRMAPPPPGVPAAPLVHSENSEGVTVTWKDDDSAASPLEYEVCAIVAGADSSFPDGSGAVRYQPTSRAPTQVVRCQAPPVVIKGLQESTPHAFRLRVRGAGGWSAWSNPCEPYTTTSEWSEQKILSCLLVNVASSLASVFRNFDADGDGFVTLQDFLDGLERAGLHSMPEQQRRRIFREADEHQRGRITVRDFAKRLCRSSNGQSIAGTPAHATPLAFPPQQGLSRSRSVSRDPVQAAEPRQGALSPGRCGINNPVRLPRNSASSRQSERTESGPRGLGRSVSERVLATAASGDGRRQRDAQANRVNAEEDGAGLQAPCETAERSRASSAGRGGGGSARAPSPTKSASRASRPLRASASALHLQGTHRVMTPPPPVRESRARQAAARK